MIPGNPKTAPHARRTPPSAKCQRSCCLGHRPSAGTFLGVPNADVVALTHGNIMIRAFSPPSRPLRQVLVYAHFTDGVLRLQEAFLGASASVLSPGTRARQEARGLPSQLTRELRAWGSAAPTLPLRALDLAELLLCVPRVGMPTVPPPETEVLALDVR